MSTKENIIIVRKEQSKARHATITSNRGIWFNNEIAQQELEETKQLRKQLQQPQLKPFTQCTDPNCPCGD